MDENQNIQGETQEQAQPGATQPEPVTFSPIPIKTSKPRGKTKTFLGIFILVIFVVGGFLIFKDNKIKQEEATPAPEIQGVTIQESPTPTSKPIDKTKTVIEIQNGTGIAGEAAYLGDILKGLGYSDLKLGNAGTQDNVTTSVIYASDLDQVTQAEITAKLEGLYKEVDVKSSATQESAVVIITGLRKGVTPKPSASPSTTLSPSPSASPSSSPSASPTATP